MKDQGQIHSAGDFQLPLKASLLVVPGGVHTVEIQAGLTPGVDFRVIRQPNEIFQNSFRAVGGIVGVDSHRGDDPGVVFGDPDRLAGRIRIDAHDHTSFNSVLSGALQHRRQVGTVIFIVQMAVAVEESHANILINGCAPNAHAPYHCIPLLRKGHRRQYWGCQAGRQGLRSSPL